MLLQSFVQTAHHALPLRMPRKGSGEPDTSRAGIQGQQAELANGLDLFRRQPCAVVPDYFSRSHPIESCVDNGIAIGVFEQDIERVFDEFRPAGNKYVFNLWR